MEFPGRNQGENERRGRMRPPGGRLPFRIKKRERSGNGRQKAVLNREEIKVCG